MRAQVLSSITTAISTLTQFAVSQELPFEADGQPLYIKNKKRLYVDNPVKTQNTMIPLLSFVNIMEDELKTNVYLVVDAKNPPTQLDSLITKVLDVKDSLGIVNFESESDYTLDTQEDILVYAFEFRLRQIKQ